MSRRRAVGAAVVAEATAERSMRASFPAIAASVRKVRHALVVFAESVGAPSQTIEAIRLVGSEAATNVVQHAYNGRPGRIHVRAIHVRAIRDSDAIWVAVADQGCG